MLGRLGSRKRGEAVPVRWGEENVFFLILDGDGLNFGV